MSPALLAVARFLHRSPLLRRCARTVGRGLTIRQRFHGGTICMDAIDHSWSWTGGRALETFDRDLQDHLLALVRPRGRFIDVGCNVGVMTLSVLLRDPQARSVSVDPNARAIELLGRSLRLNGCAHRGQLIHAAASGGETELRYAEEGSFVGHVTADGAPVPAIPLATLLAQHATQPVVLKIDIEGYEISLLDSLAKARLPAGSVALVEVHPAGFNGIGDPIRVVRELSRAPQMEITLLGGRPVAQLDPTQFSQLEISWR